MMRILAYPWRCYLFGHRWKWCTCVNCTPEKNGYRRCQREGCDAVEHYRG